MQIKGGLFMFQESETLELKSILTADIKKEIIAFSNTKGGIIYIGITDEGNIIGVSDVEKECERLSSMIHDGIKPDIKMCISISAIKIESKDIIKITIIQGTNRPYYLADKGLKPTSVYVRISNTSVPLINDEAIRNLIKENDGFYFEDSTSPIQSLTFKEAKHIFQNYNIAFKQQQRKSLGLYTLSDEYTNLALLISDQCQHSIKVAVFSDESPTSFQDRREFTGSIFKQLSETFSYILQHNQVHSSYNGLLRQDREDYSELVIRESLLNALIHRDYSYSGSIQIRIFPSRLEFISIGGLVSNFTMEDILQGISQPRNPKLATLFYRLKLIEAYGTGIQKILEDYRNSSIQPKFIPTKNTFRLELPNKNIVESSNIQSPTPSLSLEQQIIELLSKLGPLGRLTIQTETGLKQTSCNKLLNKLISEGKISRTGSGKNIKYYISSKK